MKVKSRLRRCAMLPMSPVSRLSMPITAYPRSSRASARCEPMNPAAPVMTTRCCMEPSSRRMTQIRTRNRSSVRVPLEEPLQNGEPHDLHVERHRPVLDVVEVVLDPLLDRGVAPPAIDLRPAGQARAHLVAEHVLRDTLLELVDEERPLG